MKTTTLPPMKVGKNQIVLPSGVLQSKDGKYHYWQCSVSGTMTFAKPDYWKQIMAKYKTEKNLVKAYVCRKAKKLLESGMKQAEIIKVLNQKTTYAAKKEKLEVKKIKKEREKVIKKVRKKRSVGLKGFAVGKTEVEKITDSGSFVKEVVPIYPWQGNPDYFKSQASPISVEEVTHDTCAFPNRYLSDDCKDCPIYAKCVFPQKYTTADWKKPRKNTVPIVRAIDMSEPVDTE
jgi:hypothetical protein